MPLGRRSGACAAGQTGALGRALDVCAAAFFVPPTAEEEERWGYEPGSWRRRTAPVTVDQGLSRLKHAAQREGVRSLDVVEAEATLAAYETAGDSIGIIDDPLPYD